MDATAPRRRPRPDTTPPLGRGGAWLLWALMVPLLLWPVVWNGGVLAFPDSHNYYTQGGKALLYAQGLVEGVLGGPLGGGGGGGGAAGGLGGDDGIPDIRSVPFAVSVNVLVRALGTVAPAVVLAGLTAWLIVLTVRRLPLGRAAAAALVTAGLTALPFHASVVMPDVLAGWLVLIVALIALDTAPGARPLIGRWTMAALLVLAFLAVASHLSHIPLAMALLPALGVLLLIRRRWGLAALVQVPLVATMMLNVSVGHVVTGGVSIAPARLPILVARTFTDGPGREYLEATCPESGWTLCEVYGGTIEADDLPDTVNETLWRQGAIREVSTPEQRRAIAREEIDFVLAVLRAYPAQQGAALARNAVRQMHMIGLQDVYHSRLTPTGPITATIEYDRIARDDPMRVAVEAAQWGAVAVGLVALVVALWRGGPGVRPAIVAILLGLAVNAAVCGGLSAPTDRYQGRVIWTLVLVGLALALLPRTRAEPRVSDSRGRLVRPRARMIARPPAAARRAAR